MGKHKRHRTAEPVSADVETATTDNRRPGRAVAVSTASVSLAGLTAGDAEWFESMAAVRRAAAATGSPVFAAQANAEAAGLEALAAALRDPASRGLPVLHHGQGGETAPPDNCDHPWRLRELEQAVAASPDVLAADASLDRLRLARDAGVLTTAVELAQDAGAGTAAERMLSHQLAAAHQVAMRLFTAADRDLCRNKSGVPWESPGALLEAQRSATVGARVLVAFAQGAVALDRLRNGNRQVVQVQHVTVENGGQAVVAGTVAPGGAQPSGPAAARGGGAK